MIIFNKKPKLFDLLRLFRLNTIGNFLILILLFIGLRIPAFLIPMDIPTEEGGYLYVFLIKWIGPSGSVPLLLGSILVLTQSIIVNSLVNSNNLTFEKSTYTSFFYILLCSVSLSFFPLSAIVLGNTFLLLATYNYFELSQKSDVSGRVFNTGFFIGLASFFYQPYLFILLYFLLRMGSLKNLQPKDLVQLFTGLLLPYFLIWVAAFITETTDLLWVLQWNEQFNILQSFVGLQSLVMWFIPGFFMALFLLVLFKFGDMTYKSNLMVRRKISLFYEMMLMMALILPFQSLISIQDMMSIIPFMAPLLAIAVTHMKRQILAELLPLALLMLLLFMQYYFKM